MASQQAPEVVPPIPSGQPQPKNQETATHRQPYQALPSTSQSQARFDSISIFPDAYRGTDYPSNPRFICMLEYSESIFSKPINYITVEAAARQLQSLYGPGITVSRRRRSALSRLTKYLGRLQISGRWSADVIFKIFHDLDVALFGRILCRNVSMGWKTEDSTPGMKTIPAVTYGLSGWHKGRGQRVHIALNGNMCLLDARRTLKDVVDVLLHEMIHAYLIILTGDGRDHNDPHDAEHGVNFRKCVDSVNWAVKAGGQTWIRTSAGRDWAGA